MLKKYLKYGSLTLFITLVSYVGFYLYQHMLIKGSKEQIVFESGDLKLSGVLVKPHSNATTFPVIIMLHGSGEESGSYRPMSMDGIAWTVHINNFTKRGVSVFFYDKRGTGNSEGIFEEASYDDFINDAIAVVNYLKERSDINAAKIGLFGSSEGGWFTPEIAYQTMSIDFILNRSGPPLSWSETNLWELENEWKNEGFSSEEITKLIPIRKRIWKLYESSIYDSSYNFEKEREELNIILDSLTRSYGEDRRPLPVSILEFDESYYHNLAVMVSYNPTPFINELSIPIAYVFGAEDLNVPVARAVEVLEKFREQGKDITIKVYPNAGHSLNNYLPLETAGYVDDYLDFIGNWVESRTGE